MHIVKNIINELKRNGITIHIEDDKLKLRASNNREIDSALIKQVIELKDSIKVYLRDRVSSENKQEELPIARSPVSEDGLIPLSYAQEGLWFIHKLLGNSLHYQ